MKNKKIEVLDKATIDFEYGKFFVISVFYVHKRNKYIPRR